MEKQIDMYGKEIIKVIKKNITSSKIFFPNFPKTRQLNLNHRDAELIAILKNWRNEISKQLNISPSLVLNKTTMIELSIKKPKNIDDLNNIKEIRNWQKNVFGNDIIKILNKSGGENCEFL
ncbi:MAG: HRDC domain-containing protein [Desulfobacterales bacterium]|nr:HRDC domain-containing protein [Desulfobacterales bacterium]